MKLPAITTIKPKNEVQPNELKNGDIIYYCDIYPFNKSKKLTYRLYGVLDVWRNCVEAKMIFKEKGKYRLSIYNSSLHQHCLDGTLYSKFYKINKPHRFKLGKNNKQYLIMEK